MALAWLNPFGRASLPKVPSMIQVIAASMLAHRPQDIAIGPEDVLVCPPGSSAVSFMDWSRHSELFAGAYDWAIRWIDERLRQNDPALHAVLGTSAQKGPTQVRGDSMDKSTT